MPNDLKQQIDRLENTVRELSIRLADSDRLLKKHFHSGKDGSWPLTGTLSIEGSGVLECSEIVGKGFLTLNNLRDSTNAGCFDSHKMIEIRFGKTPYYFEVISDINQNFLPVPCPIGPSETVRRNATNTGWETFVAGTGGGSVVSFSFTNANGISGLVVSPNTAPVLTLSLGAITPTSVNGLTLTSQAVGFTIAGGTISKTLTVPLDASVSGTNTGDQFGKQTEIDFGATPVSDKIFTIIDADVNVTSKITASVAYAAPTGKDLDEIEMDDLQFRCGNGAGSFNLYARAADGSYLADKFKINYLIN